jgi:hypothetical protein
MQSVFLKMTGFQEQKMKCIYWEMATNDYEYRYEFTKNPLGECSSYTDKNIIYQQLVTQIQKYNSKFDIKKDIDNKKYYKKLFRKLKIYFPIQIYPFGRKMILLSL